MAACSRRTAAYKRPGNATIRWGAAMAYKFEDLEVWTRALDYSDQVHDIAEQRPKHERYNLADQMTRAANSIALNVAV